jgi:hypothetical protein
LLHYTVGVSAENIFICKDKDLGKTLLLDSVHKKLIEELTASAALASGGFPGEVIALGSYKGNLPAILASIHLLSRKQNFLRKRTPQKDQTVFVVTPQELRKAFNSRTGLTDKSNSLSSMVLKSTLSIITSSTNRVFPGGWIVSNRALNMVKSDTGLIYKLGYSERCPDFHKLDMVLKNTVSTNPKKELILKDQSGEDIKEWSYLEFRAGSKLIAPILDQTSPDTFDKQRKVEPLRVRSDKALEVYGDQKFFKTINSLNRAHAILINLQKGNKKTKTVHYQQSRLEFLHLCDKIPIFDNKGVEHTKLSDLPSPVYKYCAKTFRFRSKPEIKDIPIPTVEKEAVPESSIDTGDNEPMVVDSQPQAERPRKALRGGKTQGSAVRTRSTSRGAPTFLSVAADAAFGSEILKHQ